MTHTLEIPCWRPTLANELIYKHWAVARRRKRSDAAVVAGYSIRQGVPVAMGRRRVSIEIAGPWRGRPPDPDAPWKSLLDALVTSRLLVDDDAAHCELGPVTYRRARQYATTITLEDLEPCSACPDTATKASSSATTSLSR